MEYSASLEDNFYSDRIGNGYYDGYDYSDFEFDQMGSTDGVYHDGATVIDGGAANLSKAELEALWKLDPRVRGTTIESHLAQTEYKDWFNVGQLNDGKFPLVDFQKDNMLVSFKTVDTKGSSW